MADIALHYDVAPTSLPLVLVPAFPLDGRMFKPLQECLSVPTITVDPPGFGDSSHPRKLAASLGRSPIPSLDTYAFGLAAALDEIGVGQVVLAGVSMGGYLAMAFAEHFGERLAGLGLIDTKAGIDSLEVREHRVRMAQAVEEGSATGSFLNPLLNNVVSPVTIQERDETYELLARWYEQAPGVGIAWAQRAMAARTNRVAMLRSLGIPALVGWGSDDDRSPRGDAEEMARALGVEVVVFERAGHMAAVEVPELVGSALADLYTRSLPGVSPASPA